MTETNPSVLNSLRQLFQELRIVADEGLSAVGGPSDEAPVDPTALRNANERLRQIAAEILAIQDSEARQ